MSKSLKTSGQLHPYDIHHHRRIKEYSCVQRDFSFEGDANEFINKEVIPKDYAYYVEYNVVYYVPKDVQPTKD
jgi:hypothetical protein